MKYMLIYVCAAFAATVTLADPRPATSAQQYAEAKRLSRAGQYAAALPLLDSALSNAVSRGDHYFAFFFARDRSKCQEQLGKNAASLQDALLALDHLAKEAEADAPRMLPQVRAREGLLLEGLVSKYYYYAHRISQARQWHEKASRSLASLVRAEAGAECDLLSGVCPAGLNPETRILIPRQLWFESMILESEARTTLALARLDAAEKLLSVPGKGRSAIEEDYYLKVLNRKARLLDFLGWLPEAIEIDRRLAEAQPTRANTAAVQGARMNLNRNLSQYYGPSETYLKEALDAYQIFKQSAGGQGDLDALRLVNKMVFDLTHDDSSKTNLVAIQNLLNGMGLQKDADYTERDLLEIQIRTGETKDTEKRLLALIESFRNNGNRTGEVTLYRNYGDLCRQLKRYDEAVYLYTRALELSRAYGWYVHLPAIMAKLAQSYLDKGDAARADEWVAAIRSCLEAHPDFPPHRRAAALTEVARLLAARGKTEACVALRSEVLAYCEQKGVPGYWVAGLRKLDAPTPQTRRAAASGATAAADTLQTDLQPRNVQSKTLPGETALAGFTLANLSAGRVSGRLVVPVSLTLTERDDEAHVLRFQVAPGASKKESQPIPISLEPSGMVRLVLSASVASEADAGAAELKWVPDGGKEQCSTWAYSAKQETADITVVNASVVELNPFYFVPIHHAIRKRGSGEILFDYTAVSSVPCHIEIVDASNGEVLAVDRQGDGSFDKEGDFVFRDKNGNLYPDHAFAADEELYDVELRVYPTGTGAPESRGDIAVTFMGAFGDQWRDLAEDILTSRQPR